MIRRDMASDDGDTVRKKAMKTFTVVMAVVASGLLAAPASAQMGGKRGKADDSKTDTKDPKKAAAEEKAYNAALQRIPDPKEKYDPWGGVAPADSSKKPK
jgi:uncharacterized membrane protein YkoI